MWNFMMTPNISNPGFMESKQSLFPFLNRFSPAYRKQNEKCDLVL